MNDIYSPATGEHIRTTDPAPWMGRAGTPAPAYDQATSSAFWRGAAWEIVLATPPAPEVPAAVTMRQARLALLGAGLLDPVNAAIAAMPGTEGAAARIEWEYAMDVRRDSPLVIGLAAALGLTGEQIDGLFVQAGLL